MIEGNEVEISHELGGHATNLGIRKGMEAYKLGSMRIVVGDEGMERRQVTTAEYLPGIIRALATI